MDIEKSKIQWDQIRKRWDRRKKTKYIGLICHWVEFEVVTPALA